MQALSSAPSQHPYAAEGRTRAFYLVSVVVRSTVPFTIGTAVLTGHLFAGVVAMVSQIMLATVLMRKSTRALPPSAGALHGAHPVDSIVSAINALAMIGLALVLATEGGTLGALLAYTLAVSSSRNFWRACLQAIRYRRAARVIEAAAFGLVMIATAWAANRSSVASADALRVVVPLVVLTVIARTAVIHAAQWARTNWRSFFTPIAPASI